MVGSSQRPNNDKSIHVGTHSRENTWPCMPNKTPSLWQMGPKQPLHAHLSSKALGGLHDGSLAAGQRATGGFTSSRRLVAPSRGTMVGFKAASQQVLHSKRRKGSGFVGQGGRRPSSHAEVFDALSGLCACRRSGRSGCMSSYAGSAAFHFHASFKAFKCTRHKKQALHIVDKAKRE